MGKNVGRIYCPYRAIDDDKCGIGLLSSLKIDGDDYYDDAEYDGVHVIYKNKAADSKFDSNDYESGSGSGSGSSEEGKQRGGYDSDLIDWECCDGNYSLEEVKALKRELKDWYAAHGEPKDFNVELDRTGACNMKTEKYRFIDPDIWDYIMDVVKMARVKGFIFEFSKPAEPWADGGCNVWGDLNTMHQGPANDSLQAQWLRKALEIYNDRINKTAKIKFMGLNRIVSYFFKYFITFTALDQETGLTGTYQAAIVPDCFLIFLRHVEADKLLAYMDV